MIADTKFVRVGLSVSALGLWGLSLMLPMLVWRNDPSIPGWVLLVPSPLWFLAFPWVLMTIGLFALLRLNLKGHSSRWLTVSFLSGWAGLTFIHARMFDSVGSAFRMGSGTLVWSVAMLLMAVASMVRGHREGDALHDTKAS